jgi:hypothetical protein
MYARHGRDLTGYKSLHTIPIPFLKIITEILAEGKGGTARKRPVEAGVMKL